eukprot:TRINITY_DN1697_c0_g1_i2.p1 TRINITY_DN1697_c0_g1~~TRINITY_DN1697_c0_g1_i2.p1  ORF type:complete len:720 (-),score=244.70 TRINITY_DN1697_c0_g1_i2:419-2578(-)
MDLGSWVWKSLSLLVEDIRKAERMTGRNLGDLSTMGFEFGETHIDRTDPFITGESVDDDLRLERSLLWSPQAPLLKELILANLEWRRRHLKGKRRQKRGPQAKDVAVKLASLSREELLDPKTLPEIQFNKAFLRYFIKELEIRSEKITCIGSKIMLFGALRQISVVGCEIEEVRYLPPSVEYVSLNGNRIKEFGPFETPLHHLIHLGLSHNQIKNVNWITKCSNSFQELLSVDLSHNYLIDLVGTVRIINKNMPKLQLLEMFGNGFSLWENYFSYVARKCENLSVLDGSKLNEDILSELEERLEDVSLDGKRTWHEVEESMETGKEGIRLNFKIMLDSFVEPKFLFPCSKPAICSHGGDANDADGGSRKIQDVSEEEVPDDDEEGDDTEKEKLPEKLCCYILEYRVGDTEAWTSRPYLWGIPPNLDLSDTMRLKVENKLFGESFQPSYMVLANRDAKEKIHDQKETRIVHTLSSSMKHELELSSRLCEWIALGSLQVSVRMCSIPFSLFGVQIDEKEDTKPVDDKKKKGKGEAPVPTPTPREDEEEDAKGKEEDIIHMVKEKGHVLGYFQIELSQFLKKDKSNPMTPKAHFSYAPDVAMTDGLGASRVEQWDNPYFFVQMNKTRQMQREESSSSKTKPVGGGGKKGGAKPVEEITTTDVQETLPQREPRSHEPGTTWTSLATLSMSIELNAKDDSHGSEENDVPLEEPAAAPPPSKKGK